jgi:hypothetical protein
MRRLTLVEKENDNQPVLQNQDKGAFQTVAESAMHDKGLILFYVQCNGRAHIYQ